jgi:hypothetical protein
MVSLLGLIRKLGPSQCSVKTKLRLDRTSLAGLAFTYGGMAERFKAAVLKTVDRKVRGFESLSLRHEACLISL